VLSALFEQHYERLVGLARLLLDERGQAEEVVQEAFARTYAGWPRVRDRDNPLPYVQRAVVNLARGGLRQRIRARRRPASVVSAAASAEDRALGHQQDQDVAAAVHALPRRQRECVVLRYYLDLSTPETARALGISVGTVKQHVHRALQHLSLALEDQR
jgi:RNA polymerase sigma-70 factor (sigma-E family)